jgi:hypothetical protein
MKYSVLPWASTSIPSSEKEIEDAISVLLDICRM